METISLFSISTKKNQESHKQGENQHVLTAFMQYRHDVLEFLAIKVNDFSIQRTTTQARGVVCEKVEGLNLFEQSHQSIQHVLDNAKSVCVCFLCEYNSMYKLIDFTLFSFIGRFMLQEVRQAQEIRLDGQMYDQFEMAMDFFRVLHTRQQFHLALKVLTTI